MSRLAWPLLAVTVFAAAIVVVATRFVVVGDVTAFLPNTKSDERVAISKALARSGLGRQMIVVVSSPRELVASATVNIAMDLAANDHFEWAHTGVDRALGDELRATFFPARFGFISETPTSIEERLSDDGLREAAKSLKRALSGPLGATVRSTVGSDPLMLHAALIARLRGARPPSLDVEGGAFITADESNVRGIIFVATKASPFDASRQRDAIAAIAAAAARQGSDVSAEITGVGVLAVDGEQSTRADVKRISIASLLGTTLLFLLCFRRFHYLLMLAVPIAFGVVGGLAASLIVFGEVHGMTLAFGATMIGVSVDYVIHFLAHHVLEPRSARESLASVWSGIALGGATTIIGFVGMGMTSTPGMQQIALFGAFGIGFALLATYSLLPLLAGKAPTKRTGLAAVHARVDSVLAALPGWRWVLATGALLIAGASALAIPNGTWNDNPRGLAAVSPTLMEADERIRGLVAGADSGRFVVARGRNWSEALAANDQAAAILAKAVVADELESFRSLHALLWSPALQQTNIDALWASPALPNRLRLAMADEGFRPEAFDEMSKILAGPKPSPLDPETVIAGPLHPLLRGFFAIAGDGDVLILTHLKNVRSGELIASRLGTNASLTYFDQSEFLESSYRGFRQRVLLVVTLSLLAVFALVFIRYRNLRMTVAATMPAILAAAAALGALAAVGMTLNLLHVLGLMLVLSIGVDYGVFVVEASRQSGEMDGSQKIAIAILGTGVSCATTILGFGLLAMSSNPALQALGSITALGCIFSLVFAPAALALLKPTENNT